MNLRVRLLGHPRIEGPAQQPCQPPRGQKSWALLARLALAERPLTRGELAAELFGEADDPLGALRWCLADLRRCCQNPRLLRGDPLSLADGCLWVDVRALWDGSLPAAEITGTLLQSVEPRNCPAFDVWLVAAGHPARAAVHLSACEAMFAREGLACSPALQSAARPAAASPGGLRASVVAKSLLRAGKAALDAGSADAGVETLRRAAAEAEHVRDPLVLADVLAALGSALVHAVRGLDGEGAVVLNRALAAARSAGSQPPAEILRELAFVDVQAGRHASAARALREAWAQAEALGDPALTARVLAVRGMNEADQGHHDTAVRLLAQSARTAESAGSRRQEAWSTGVMARSLLLAGQVEDARAAAEHSIDICDQERWNAFVPWPQALRAHCLAAAGRYREARDDAESAFALACELGDPCWEGMAGRALALLALHAGDPAAAGQWITDARRRCDRLPDRYVWVSGFVALGHLEINAVRRRDGRRSPGRFPGLWSGNRSRWMRTRGPCSWCGWPRY